MAKNTKQLNRTIIKKLFIHQPVSLAVLTRLCNKSLPLVSAEINDLLAKGIVVEQGLAPSTGGRRAQEYLLNASQRYFVIAVAMDQLSTCIAVYNLQRKTVSKTHSIKINLQQDQDALEKLIDGIKLTIQNNKLKSSEILGIGVGMPGIVNLQHDFNYSYLNPPNEMNLTDYLSEQLDVKVTIDNDSSLIALSELNFGKVKDCKDALVVNIGWGTGLGIIIDGKLYRGSTGYAGEFSHIPLANDNTLCSCGKKGCIEVETSLLVLAEKARVLIEEGNQSLMDISGNKNDIELAKAFLDALKKHDALALSVLAGGAYIMGKGIATLIHIFNPETIVLAGRGAEVGEVFLPSIQQAINEFCIPRIATQTKIEISELERAELLAAACLALENGIKN